MPSSTSSSDLQGFERSVPGIPWLPTLALVASLTMVLLVGWELAMRNLGLQPGDLDDGRAYWTEERRKLNAGPRDPLVIIGDSRILFDTNLETWKELTGRRPIQLALMGANAEPILHDLASDEHFAGLLVIGTAEFSYFSHDAGSMPDVIEYMNRESPSQRIGHYLYRAASRHLAFLDSNYTLFTLIERHPWRERENVKGPYLDVWKISEAYDGRQTYLWSRLERDAELRRHAEEVWVDIFAGEAVAAELVDEVSARSRAAIERIRARGGEVVWVRPPSAGPILATERARYPRREVWDRLVRDTGSFGVHFEDFPAMRQYEIPDSSHLSRASAVEFTEAYVRELLENVPWLQERHGDDVRNRKVTPLEAHRRAPRAP